MADQTDGTSPKRSSLEEDDGCHFYHGASAAPRFSKQNLLGGAGMDVYDSGVSLTSFGCDVVPSYDVCDPVKAHIIDQQTCVSVGYTSFDTAEDALGSDSTLAGQMEGLSIACETTSTTTTTTSTETYNPSTELLDQRKAFVDRLQLCFAPDVDGDT